FSHKEAQNSQKEFLDFLCFLCSLWLLILRRRATTSTALPGNSTQRDHRSTICSGESAGPGVFGTISGGVGSDRDLFTALEYCLIDTTIETIPIHDVRIWNLQCPIQSSAFRIFCVQIDPTVRILYHDFCELSNERQRFAPIVLCLKRVMRRCRNRSGEHGNAENCGRDFLHRKPPGTNFHLQRDAGSRTTRKPTSLTRNVGP